MSISVDNAPTGEAVVGDIIFIVSSLTKKSVRW